MIPLPEIQPPPARRSRWTTLLLATVTFLSAAMALCLLLLVAFTLLGMQQVAAVFERSAPNQLNPLPVRASTPHPETLTEATQMVTRTQTVTAPNTVAATPLVTPRVTKTPMPPQATTTPTLQPTTPPTPHLLYLPAVMRQEPLTLRNGDFEAGTTVWQESSSKSLRLILKRDELEGIEPHSGEWAAWLGGQVAESSILSQQFMVPLNQTTLTYWRAVAIPENCGRDVATVLITNSTVNEIEQFNLCTVSAPGWTRQTKDLSVYAGATVTLEFRVDTAGNAEPSSLFIDDVAWE